MFLIVSCYLEDREHSGTECVFLCVSGSVAQETLTCPVSPGRQGTLKGRVCVPYRVLLLEGRVTLTCPVSGSSKDREHSREECVFPIVCEGFLEELNVCRCLVSPD